MVTKAGYIITVMGHMCYRGSQFYHCLMLFLFFIFMYYQHGHCGSAGKWSIMVVVDTEIVTAPTVLGAYFNLWKYSVRADEDSIIGSTDKRSRTKYLRFSVGGRNPAEWVTIRILYSSLA